MSEKVKIILILAVTLALIIVGCIHTNLSMAEEKEFYRVESADNTVENINFVKENDVIEIGAERLHVIETPGHTKNDIMLIDYKNMLIFTGDTLLRGRLPRQLTNYNNLMASIRKILFYPKISDEFKIYPGHGGYSTIGKERVRY